MSSFSDGRFIYVCVFPFFNFWTSVRESMLISDLYICASFDIRGRFYLTREMSACSFNKVFFRNRFRCRLTGLKCQKQHRLYTEYFTQMN